MGWFQCVSSRAFPTAWSSGRSKFRNTWEELKSWSGVCVTRQSADLLSRSLSGFSSLLLFYYSISSLVAFFPFSCFLTFCPLQPQLLCHSLPPGSGFCCWPCGPTSGRLQLARKGLGSSPHRCQGAGMALLGMEGRH